MSVDFANMTYESKSGEIAGKVTTIANGRAEIHLRSQMDARSVWELDSRHNSMVDACEVLEEILENN